METWKPVNIPGYSEYSGFYEVSDCGRVRRSVSDDNTWVGRILKPTFKNGESDNYMRVTLFCPIHGRKMFLLHRLVAMAFIPNPNNLPEVNHDSGIKTDCSVGNLGWVTTKKNAEHKYATGLQKGKKGSENHAAKLTENQVLDIRKRIAAGQKRKEVAKEFGIHEMTTYKITQGIRWGHI